MKTNARVLALWVLHGSLRSPGLPHTQSLVPPGSNLVRGFALALASLLALAGQSRASTFVTGTVSGTWTPTGSPYIATGNLTVSSGQTLTIQPGVTLIIGQGLNMDVEGTITAVGTAAQPIVIRGANSSLYWDKIYINYTGSAPSSFVNCYISGATNALYIYIDGHVAGNASMNTVIQNCIITNCVGSCLYGYSHGWSGWLSQSTYVAFFPILSPTIQNSLFGASTNGCIFLADGTRSSYGMGYGIGSGSVNPQIVNCDFVTISGVALNFDAGTYAGTSYPTNLNNIFLQCGTAVQKNSATLVNDTPAYNCFFTNQANFVGYPGLFGTICCVNDRGINCDLANNIFDNPLFVGATNYTLATNSPCIDAGSPAWALTDMCFPPSQGTATPDLGIYGGPNAANWLPVVPKLPAEAFSVTKSNNSLWLNWGAIPRSSYQVQYLTTNFNATAGTNRWLTNSTVTASDKPVSIAVSPFPTTNSGAFYRIRSMGRTPGN